MPAGLQVPTRSVLPPTAPRQYSNANVARVDASVTAAAMTIELATTVELIAYRYTSQTTIRPPIDGHNHGLSSERVCRGDALVPQSVRRSRDQTLHCVRRSAPSIDQRRSTLPVESDEAN